MAPGIEPTPTKEWQSRFLKQHELGAAYLEIALKWFNPLACALAEHQDDAGRPVLVAINGCQGSGKTTVADYLCATIMEEHGLNAVALSLDDFYLTRNERQALAASVHPLFATRGVPGTHDTNLLRRTLTQLLNSQSRGPVAVPRFDKVADDRRSDAEWDSIIAPVQVVLLEGWCLGAGPQRADQLSRPLNDLEKNEDPQGQWRGYSNDVLRREFLPLYQLVDQWVMLCAPSFDCVFDWRREQERKLEALVSPQQASALMDDDALRRFIQHYERFTRECLSELPQKVNHLFRLDDQRRVTAYIHRPYADVSPPTP
jgi:D-glycerate 3-kinase